MYEDGRCMGVLAEMWLFSVLLWFAAAGWWLIGDGR